MFCVIWEISLALKPSHRKPLVRVGYRAPLDPLQSAVTTAGFMYDKQKANAVRNRTLSPRHYIVMFVLEGEGVYVDASGERRVRAGDLFISFPGLSHSYWPDPAWTEAYIAFQGGLFAQLEIEGLINRNTPVLSPGLAPALVSSFNSLVEDFIKEQPLGNPIHTARAHMLLAQVVDLHNAAKTARRGSDFLRRACAMLEERLETELDMQAVARHFNFGYERFRKLFAAETGVSPAKYRILRRVDRAKTLLTEGRIPLKAIAEQLGYCDVYFFARQFKQVTGKTPGEFRRLE